MCKHQEHNHNFHFLQLLKIGTSVAILILALLITSNSNYKLFLFLLSYVLAGGDILFNAFKNILKCKFFDENFLMGIATLGAIGIKEYPEAIMVMVLYQMGELLQHKAVEKSRKSIHELMDIRPDFANIEVNGKIIQKPPKDIDINDIIIVKAGERIPLDGKVIEGTSTVDTSALTGESTPKIIKPHDKAISGCINISGPIKICVEKTFGTSTASKILELVEHASAKKTKSEKFITRFAKYYTPAVVISAIFLAIFPPILTATPYNIWLERALTFLVISCPCALVISIPLSFFSGLGSASKQGILIKGSTYIETLANAGTIVFDKTGTLTKGTFEVTSILPVNNEITKEDLLMIAAAAEKYSNHPIAQSIKNAYNKPLYNNITFNVKEISGLGIQATINNDKVLVGNEKLLTINQITPPKTSLNGTKIYIARNGQYIGLIVISDKLKEDTIESIYALQKTVEQIIMLTGDNEKNAETIAHRLGIKKYYSELLPNDKVNKIEEIMANKKTNKSVIFVGDGINDAPVLTRSDVGIAMGALGSDAAIEAADAVIMDDNISKLITAIKISKNTMNIVKENIIFSIGIKLLFLTLSLFGLISIWGAVFADVGVTLLAVLNATRLLRN